MLRRAPTTIMLLALALLSCSHDSGPRKITTVPVVSMELVSVGFLEGQSIPDRYTCDGDNSSPPLQWSGAPKSTESLAIICEDLDAPGGTWVHWVIFDIPAKVRELG